MSVDSVDDLQRDFADVDINGSSTNNDDAEDYEENVPTPAEVFNSNNNNGINDTFVHVSAKI